jgi:hypothetical protein
MDAAASNDSAASVPQTSRGPLWGLVVGLACGAAVGALVQAVHPVFAVPQEFHIAGIGAPREQHIAFERQQDIVDRRHVMLYLAVAGLLLGAALGKTLERSWRVAGLAAARGLIGAGLGAFFATLFHFAIRNRVAQDDLLSPFLRQLIIGVIAGAWLGMGLMMRRGSWSAMGRGLAVGAVGGVLFAVVNTLLVALFLPEANTHALLPEEAMTRLAWFTSFAGCLGLAGGFAARGALRDK